MKQNLSNMTFSNCFVDILKSNNIKNVCICPGSRNTALSIAFLNNSFFKCMSHIDERGASFFSLGISKVSLKPSVIVTTSGTAAANLLPATIEADLSSTPLIVISADRPKLFHNTGENQTINQRNILNDFVRESLHVEVSAADSNAVFNKLQSMIEQAKGIQGEKPPGPVHINIAFDEPLVDKSISKKINVKKIISKKDSSTFTIPECKRPLIICGKIDDKFSIKKIIQLSKKLNAPIFADSLSDIRYKAKDPNILSFYDFFVDDISPYPDFVIRFGKKPVSKKLNQFLKRLKNRTVLLTQYNGYNDDAKSVCISNLNKIKTKSIHDKKWLVNIQNLNEKVYTDLKKYYDKKYFHEGNIIYHCLKELDDDNNLFIGNSLPIRNLEKFCPNMDKKITVYSNRGASGIDGLIATAIGTAHSHASKTTLILGDVSFFYDSSSLLIANKYKININIIVINNKGGQIFSKLPYAKNNIKDFEEFWTTPVDLSIKKISQLYKANYTMLNSIEKINKQLKNALMKSGINIIEILCDFNKTLEIEQKIEKEF